MQVYLNNQSLFEVDEYNKLINPKTIKETHDHWTNKKVTYDYENVSNYQWFAEVEDRITTLYANFQEYDPNED